MMQTLRIISTILSAICLVAIIPVGALLNFTWALFVALGAGFFYLLMLIFKKRQEFSQGRSEEEPDFLHPQSADAKKDE